MKYVSGAAAIALVIVTSPVHARWKPEYAAVSQELRDWFSNMRVPGNGGKCCNDADGTKAERRYGPKDSNTIEVRFFAETIDANGSREVDSGWVTVPSVAIIHNTPNLNVAPTVWWYWIGPVPYGPQSLRIRCFIDGPEG